MKKSILSMSLLRPFIRNRRIKFYANERNGMVRNCGAVLWINRILIGSIYALVNDNGAVTLVFSDGIMSQETRDNLMWELMNHLRDHFTETGKDPRNFYLNSIDSPITSNNRLIRKEKVYESC